MKPTYKVIMNFNGFSRLKSLFVFAFILTMSSTVFAQDEEIEITDEDVKKYAVTMDSLDVMKENVKNVMSEMLKSNEDITIARYNELNDAIGDEEKLAELEATEEEVSFIQSVIDKKEELTAQIKPTLTTMVKDYIGSVKMYNAIKKGLKSDEELKAKYDTFMEELKASRASEDGEVNNEESENTEEGR